MTKRLTMAQKNIILGIFFILPWLSGFILLMGVPLIQSLRFSFSELKLTGSGYILEYVGWENYHHAFFVHPWFNRILTGSVTTMLLNLPLVIFFSLFSATLLAQEFKGRMWARAVFFLPVLLASGVIANIDSNNFAAELVMSSGGDLNTKLSALSNFDLIPILFRYTGIRNIAVLNYIAGAVDRIYQIVASSGVQMLIFLAGLQAIPPAIYEAAKMEGITGYEAFWKITFPMMTPFILTNTVYTIVDSFYNNSVTTHIQQTAFGHQNFGLSSAMSWAYFTVIAIILMVSTYSLSKRVFYYN